MVRFTGNVLIQFCLYLASAMCFYVNRYVLASCAFGKKEAVTVASGQLVSLVFVLSLKKKYHHQMISILPELFFHFVLSFQLRRPIFRKIPKERKSDPGSRPQPHLSPQPRSSGGCIDTALRSRRSLSLFLSPSGEGGELACIHPLPHLFSPSSICIFRQNK